MGLFDAFFLSMIFFAGVVSIPVILHKFIKDMRAECGKDKLHNKAVRNTFKLNKNNGPMAVRNK